MTEDLTQGEDGDTDLESDTEYTYSSRHHGKLPFTLQKILVEENYCMKLETMQAKLIHGVKKYNAFLEVKRFSFTRRTNFFTLPIHGTLFTPNETQSKSLENTIIEFHFQAKFAFAQ